MEMFNIETYEKLKPHERSLVDLVESIDGNCSKDVTAASKLTTIRFNYDNYPQLKAISDISGNSFNTVVNEVLTVGIATLLSNLNEKQIQVIQEKAEPIKKEMLEVK